jgi:HlyD family secretion protein
MDTAIEEQVIARKRRRTLLVLLAVIVSMGGAIWLLRHSLQSSIKRSSITVAVVEKGNVENTLNASGEVLPEFEEIITSPIAATIQKALLDAGSPVKAGQSVLVLDKAATQLDFEKLRFQLESKRNSIHKTKLDLDQSFFDLQSNNDIKQLRINSLEASVENAGRLLKAGGGTREDVEQAELNLRVAKLEKQQLENQIRSKQQTMRTDIRESEIAAQIQENDLKVLERKLNQANLVASRAGVVTWINKNIGATVKEGESLARIADLSSFKVSGSISDNYIDQLHRNMRAIVRINEIPLQGVVVNIYPSVQNGIVTFDVQLNERSNKLLRPNMKVDVFLITDLHNGVLRVANGPAFKGPSAQDIFVVENGVAVHRKVHIGLTNFDYVEIKDNVKAGESVIISDLSEYKNTNQINIIP